MCAEYLATADRRIYEIVERYRAGELADDEYESAIARSLIDHRSAADPELLPIDEAKRIEIEWLRGVGL
jgi:hypothetical protein